MVCEYNSYMFLVSSCLLMHVVQTIHNKNQTLWASVFGLNRCCNYQAEVQLSRSPFLISLLEFIFCVSAFLCACLHYYVMYRWSATGATVKLKEIITLADVLLLMCKMPILENEFYL